ISGEGPHLQRQTGVTEADRTVRPEQEGELILHALHGRPSRLRRGIYAFVTESRRTLSASTLGATVAGGRTVTRGALARLRRRPARRNSLPAIRPEPSHAREPVVSEYSAEPVPRTAPNVAR